MGSVWLGVHLSLGVNVAIKFMDAQLAETADYASFDQEARAAAQLRSEHTVRVYDHGIDAAGLPYLVMEYLSGETLWSRVAEKGALDVDVVVTCIDHVARALGEAHGRGIIHRDVKPENILLIDDVDRPLGFSAKLIDFGLAKAVTPRGRPHDGPTAGTPSYMSPEHLSGDTGATPALDLWALAATAFVAMTGTIPFDGEELHDVYRAVCTDPLPVPSRAVGGIPAGFDAWFAKACARDPAARFASAAELSSSLAAACRDRAGSSSVRPAASPLEAMLATDPDAMLAARAAAVGG